MRMYLRIQAVGGSAHAELAFAIKEGTDFWSSHVVAVKIGEHPPLVRAMVRRQAGEETRLPTNDLRKFAKALTRTLTNIVPSLLTEDDAAMVAGELWDSQLSQMRSTASAD